METQNQKWVTSSFLAVAILVGYLLFAAAFQVSGFLDLEAKIKNFELTIRLLSIGVGALIFFGLHKWGTANQFMSEVVDELSKVTWPLSKDTWNSTWVVLIFVVVASALIAVIDWVWTSFIHWVLG